MSPKMEQKVKRGRWRKVNSRAKVLNIQIIEFVEKKNHRRKYNLIIIIINPSTGSYKFPD